MKKILIFSDCQADYLSYMTHHGFCELYGGYNVITYPFKKTHHGEIDDKCYLDDGFCGTNVPSEVTKPLIGKELTANEILPLIINGEIELSIIQSPRTHALCAARQMSYWIKKFKVPLIYIDGEDGTDIKLDIINEFKPLLSFKRELLPHFKTNKILPLPFSCCIDADKYPDKEKDIDVFFSVGLTHERRKLVLNKLRTIDTLNIFTSDDSNRLSFDEYIDKMSRAKINVICRGHGWDTVRRFEATSFSGVVLSDKIPIVTPNPFQDGENIVYYEDDLSDLIDKTMYYINNPIARKEIGEAGQKHLLNYHTAEKRAEYIINKVREVL